MTDNAKSEFYSEDELQLLKAVETVTLEFNRQAALSGEPTDALEDVIGRFSERSLIDLSHLFGTRRHFKNMTREETIATLAEALCDSDNMAGLLQVMPTDARITFERGVRDELADDALVANEVAERLQGMAFMAMFVVDGKVRYVVPREIKTAYEATVTPEFTALLERNDLVSDLLVAAANLYGIVHYDDMVDLVNGYLDEAISEADFYELVQKGVQLDEGYFLTKDDNIVCSSLEEWSDAEIDELALTAKAVPRYKPSKENLLKHVRWTYFEPSEQADSLEMTLNVTFPGNPPIGADALMSIQDLVQQGAQLDEIEDTLEYEFGLPLRDDPDKYAPIIDEIVDLANVTRMWTLNGHTPKEMQGFSN